MNISPMLSPTVIPIPPSPTPVPPSPSITAPVISTTIPKLKIKHLHETLHLGDSMRIIAVHEKGYMAQLNGSGVEVLLVQGLDSPHSLSSDDSPPSTTRSLPPSSSPSRRSSSLPSPSRSLSQPSPSRSLDGLDLGDLRLSPRTSSSSSLLPLLNPRSRASRRMTTKGDTYSDITGRRSPRASSSSPRAQSNPTSPRPSSPLSATLLSPPIPPTSRSPPRQRRGGMKPITVQVCSNIFVNLFYCLSKLPPIIALKLSSA